MWMILRRGVSRTGEQPQIARVTNLPPFREPQKAQKAPNETAARERRRAVLAMGLGAIAKDDTGYWKFNW
jgi:hypothetical protein